MREADAHGIGSGSNIGENVNKIKTIVINHKIVATIL